MRTFSGRYGKIGLAGDEASREKPFRVDSSASEFEDSNTLFSVSKDSTAAGGQRMGGDF